MIVYMMLILSIIKTVGAKTNEFSHFTDLVKQASKR